MKRNLLLTLTLTLCLCASTSVFATDGTWNADDNTYSVATNWVSDTIADGAGAKAYFNNQMNDVWDAKYVLVDSARTLGEIYFGSSSGYSTYWVLQSGTITLDNSGSTPVIDVAGIWGAMIDSIAGANGFNKTGADILRFYGDNSISGTVTASAGILGVYGPNALKNADVVVAGANLEIGNNAAMTANSLTINSGVLIAEQNAATANSVTIPITCNDAYDYGNNSAVLVPAGGTLSITNVTMTAATMFDIQYAGGTLNLNGDVSGNYVFALRGAYDANTFNINGKIANTGNHTILRTWGGNARIELNNNNVLPLHGGNNEIQMVVDNQSPWAHKPNTGVTLDLNNTTQKVNKLTFDIAAYPSNNYVEITGGSAGLLEITNNLWSTSPNVASNALIKLTGGKILFNGPHFSLGQKMSIANATLINNGAWWSAADACFELKSGAVVGGNGFFGWSGGKSSNLVVTAGATIAPGNSIGRVGAWNLEMAEGSLYDWEVEIGNWDEVDVRGDLKLPVTENSVTVNVSRLDSVQPDQTNILFRLDWGSGTVDGDVDSIFMNYPPSLASSPEHPEIVGGNVIITGLIPEPATFGLLSILAFAFLRRK